MTVQAKATIHEMTQNNYLSGCFFIDRTIVLTATTAANFIGIFDIAKLILLLLILLLLLLLTSVSFLVLSVHEVLYHIWKCFPVNDYNAIYSCILNGFFHNFGLTICTGYVLEVRSTLSFRLLKPINLVLLFIFVPLHFHFTLLYTCYVFEWFLCRTFHFYFCSDCFASKGLNFIIYRLRLQN